MSATTITSAVTPLRVSGDLTAAEQKAMRTALRFLYTRCGTWAVAADALHLHEGTLRNVMSGRPVSASLAVRVARFLGASIDDLLAGRYPPPGTCPFCGHSKTDESIK